MAQLIGTAGHVDHGKTSLIRALTGIDADRLPEEKARGMTIDIGFAFVDLPRSGRVSIVDVPGHERFISNMLVGAAGIDVALLCVAADESVMPQTREHLQILELLPVDEIIVALTRADLADADLRELAMMEVQHLIAESRFGAAQVIPVSVVTGEGLDTLRNALDEALLRPIQEHDGPWFMPIDRVFAVKGHGTVVTGTLARGTVKTDEIAQIEPGGISARIRAIHIHNEQVVEGEKGRRVALNLGGVKSENIRRGQLIGRPGAVFASRVVDTKLNLVGEIRHAERIRASIGADDALGKAFLSEADPSLVQLRFDVEVGCAQGQPVIVRKHSPPDLLGGGRILVPQAKVRRKTEEAVAIGTELSAEDAVLLSLDGRTSGVSTEELCRSIGRSSQDLGQPLENLKATGKVEGFAGLWFTAQDWQDARERVVAALQNMHEHNPTLALLPRDRALDSAGFHWHGKPLERILQRLEQEGTLVISGPGVRLASFAISLNPKQRQFLDNVVAKLREGGINSPSESVLTEALHVPPQAIQEILRIGCDAQEIVRLQEGIFYSIETLTDIRRQIETAFGSEPFTAAQFRDKFQSSRKYVIPLLEYLDSVGFTVRVGDQRKVRR